MELVTEVPLEHREELSRSIEKVNSFNDSLNSYLSLMLALEDYNNFYESYQNNIKKDPTFSKYNVERFYSLARYRSQNLIINFGLYLEHSVYILKKRLGRKNPGFKKFDRKKNFLSKYSFFFNLLLNLRNYAKHLEYPISEINYESIKYSVPKIEIIIKNSDLLKNYSEWNNIVKRNLQKRSDQNINFNVIIKIIKKYSKGFNGIFLNAIVDHCRKEIEYLLSHVSEYIESDKTLVIILIDSKEEIYSLSEKKDKIPVEYFPENLIKFFKRISQPRHN